IDTKIREYLPGYGRLGFMMLLKSLIDPSYFRVEEQGVRGDIHIYAKGLWNRHIGNNSKSLEKYHQFFNAVDELFRCYKGELDIRHDHSFAYRHRNKRLYSYRNYTFQELTGIVNTIFEDIVDPSKPEKYTVPSQFFFTDWNLALVQLTTSHHLGIDNRIKLFQKLKQKVPRAYFPGQYVRYEMEFFILQPIRAILGLDIEEELTEQGLNKNIRKLPKVYIFAPKSYLFYQSSAASIRQYLDSTLDKELHILYKSKVVELITTPQSCIGFHLRQMGIKGLKVLRDIKEQKGFIITNGQSAAMMTDILDIDRFHIGKVKRVLTEKIMGIPMNSGFIQFVPAGVRTSLAYPTPVQTSKDFEQALKSKSFKKLSDKIGQEKLYELLREDAQENGTPIRTFMKNLEDSFNSHKSKKDINYRFVGGVYADGMPWSGVLAEVDVNKSTAGWNFSTYSALLKPKPVTELIKEFQRKSGKKAQIAWNGGYILNPELVGKLGLPEAYIGSPLGLLMVNNEVKCPPLFNKPAFLIYEDGRLEIRRVNCSGGFSVLFETDSMQFSAKYYNEHSDSKPCYYDLSYDKSEINADGNVIVRLAGNTIKEIIHTDKGQYIPVIPVGITLSIPTVLFNDKMFKLNQDLEIKLLSQKQFEWTKIKHAVEAGPMLVENGKPGIDMQKEGWKTTNSINIQAARLDFTDMRGPKIAVGLKNNANLLVLAINGRIRESVGATHNDMADILISYGAETAMGFDPGGSSTLVVDGKVLNISPYNKDYEQDIYSLPPQPRFVANAVLGWQE
ncbi:phosphodiester glycosidase family protein, partial [bacterium]|nr:phosphodiester glycosidase family protein [bacterium]